MNSAVWTPAWASGLLLGRLCYKRMTDEYSMQSVAAEPNDVSSWGRGVVKNAGDHMQ